MPKSIDSLVEDIYGLFDEDTHHEPSEENLEWIAEAFKDLLRRKLSTRDRDAATLRFSSMGRPDRQVWYATHEPDKAEPIHPKTYFKFLYGDVIELLLLFLAKESGHEVEALQGVVAVDGIEGHVDAIIDGCTVDCKSASPFSFNKFRSGGYLTEDPFGYIGQIGGYRNALKTERAGFLVANKVHGDITFAEVPKDVLEEHQPEGRIRHLKEVLDNPLEPARCYPDKPEGASGNRILDVACSYCPFKAHCWRDANGGKGLRTFLYSNGPKFFTTVKKEPRVEEDW